MPYIFPGVLLILGIGGFLWSRTSKAADSGYPPQQSYPPQSYPQQGYPQQGYTPAQGPPQSVQQGYEFIDNVVSTATPIVQEVVNAVPVSRAPVSAGMFGLPSNYKKLSTPELIAMLNRAMTLPHGSQRAGREQFLRMELHKRDSSFPLQVSMN
jgi:hypothetical protein